MKISTKFLACAVSLIVLGMGKTVCEEPHDYPRSVAVGDIIYTDGTTSSKDAELTSGKTPVAVVAGFNENGVMFGLGLKSRVEKWATADYTANYRIKFPGLLARSDKTGEGSVSTATITGDTDGSDNWEHVKITDPIGTADAATKYPAFNFAATYATTAGITGEIAKGWYMPSIAELCVLYKNKDIINDSLIKCGGFFIISKSNSYWSSSLNNSYNGYGSGHAWRIICETEELCYSDMGENSSVCCVRAF